MALLNDQFDNLSLFYENNSTVIYKGDRKTDGTQVFLKSHKNPEDLFRIKHEYDLLHGKNILGATNVLDISYNDDKNYLVLKDNGAVVLDDYLAGNEIDIRTFLKIAENAAKSLETIHQQDIIHCDIKPANMLIHPQTLEISYIDFGISFLLHQRENKTDGFAGTLEYMAPEQTGRLNMVVDNRSDLYSLGITLYSILTAHLPFTGNTAVELIHAQTVLPPTPISEYVDVDPLVADIVLKLMEKAPRKRYQSAGSLIYDLERCQKMLQDDESITPFTLGEKDVFASLEPGNKLFGKEGALEEMMAVFHSTPADKSSLIMLHGPPDAGKSSLTKVFQEYVEANKGYLLTGSFDWKDNGEPYSAIREAFEGFELYAYNVNLPLPEYRNRILEELGSNAQVLLDILPSFESIIGKQPPVVKLGPLESQERAKQVFRKMLEILCNDAPYPYVFIFEDIHLADSASIALLLSAIESKTLGNCIMVLSYQDDDPTFLSQFVPRTNNLNRSRLTVTDVQVAHLDTTSLTSLVTDIFDLEDMQARELADIVYSATSGVISKVHMYLQHMYRNKQVQYDADTDSWSLHFDSLDHNILQVMENKYKDAFDALPEKTRDYLCKLSCIGEHFNLEEAIYIFQLDGTDLALALQKVAGEWLMVDKKIPGRYTFTHKTIYDLCYNQLSEEQKIEAHQLIVWRLYELYRDNRDEMLSHSTLFTRQVLSIGREHFEDAVLQDIARYKLMAATQIMEAANMSQAAYTFANGLRLLGEKPFEYNYKLAYELHLGYSMCLFALHEYEKATELFEAGLKYVTEDGDKYNAYYKIVTQYLASAEWEQAKIYCKRYLKDVGLLLPAHIDIIEAGEKEYQKFQELTGDDGIMLCTTFEHTEDLTLEHCGNMLIMLADALLFNLEDGKCKYYLYKAINLSVENRCIYSEFTRAFCVAAARYASVGDYKWAKHLIETGLSYADKNNSAQAFLWCVYGNMISHWVNPLKEIEEIYKKAKYYAVMEGNAFYEAFADMMLLNYHSFIGENLVEYHRETQTTLHNLRRSRINTLQATFTTFRQYARCLMGRTSSPDSFDDEQFKEDSLEKSRDTWNGIFNDNFFFIYRLRALYIHGYYDKALEYAEKFTEFSKQYNMSAYLTQVQYYYYYSMTLLEICRLCPEKQEEYLPVIRQNQTRMKRIARLNPLNFEYKYMLVETGIKNLSSDAVELIDEYSLANRGFVAKGLIWDVIFVERLVHNYWERRGVPQYLVIHKKNMLKYYKEIGARHLIRELSDVDDEKQEEHTYSTIHTTHATHTTHMGSTFLSATFNTNATNPQYSGINMALDFQALLAILEKLIKLDTLPSLTSEFLSLLLQNGNADKAMLFLDDGSVTNLFSAKFAVDSDSAFNESELPIDISIVEDSIIPKKLIELAKNKKEVLFANSARNEYKLIGDSYLNSHSPESFLCMPVEAKGKHLGTLYMENAALSGSFPEGRIRFLQTIVMQASALILNLQNVSTMELYTKELEQRLSSYLGQQNALIAGIAHEINSPVGVCLTVSTKLHEKTLSLVKSFSEKALSKGALVKYLEETRDGLNIINNNITRAGDLVQNFKKMSVEQSTEVFENLQLAPTIQNIVEYIRPGVKKKLDKVDLDIPEDLWVYTSSGVLAQIFTNLIMNSAIHGFENMDRENCRASIQVRRLDNRDEIEIRYSDNGKGMNVEEQSKVFQPFFTTKRNRGGSGLGGHIILTLITQTLNGSVRCISAPGEGTTFVIRLPIEKIDAPAKEVPGNE